MASERFKLLLKTGELLPFVSMNYLDWMPFHRVPF